MRKKKINIDKIKQELEEFEADLKKIADAQSNEKTIFPEINKKFEEFVEISKTEEELYELLISFVKEWDEKNNTKYSEEDFLQNIKLKLRKDNIIKRLGDLSKGMGELETFIEEKLENHRESHDIIKLPFRSYMGDDPFVFVSYSHKNNSNVYLQMKWIHDEGYKIWYDEGIPPTSEWPEEVENALRKCSIFIVFMTEQAQASINVRNEINFAINEGKKILCIFLESVELKHGLKLRMGSMQFLNRYNMSESLYKEKVNETLKKVLVNF